MQPTDREWRTHESCSPSLRVAHHSTHAPHHDPQGVIHPLGDLAEGHLAGWEAAWIDLGGEG